MKKSLHLKTILLSFVLALVFSTNLRSQCTTTFTMGQSAPLTWTVVPTYPVGASMAYWSWGDGNWSTGMYPSHTYSAAGFYTICVTAINTVASCSATTCDTSYVYRTSESNAMIQINVISASATSITEQKNHTAPLSVFPNPSTGKFKLKNMTEEGVLAIYSVLGVKVKEIRIEKDPELEIDLSGFENGIYSLEFDNGKKVLHEKVIISR